MQVIEESDHLETEVLLTFNMEKGIPCPAHCKDDENGDLGARKLDTIPVGTVDRRGNAATGDHCGARSTS